MIVSEVISALRNQNSQNQQYIRNLKLFLKFCLKKFLGLILSYQKLVLKSSPKEAFRQMKRPTIINPSKLQGGSLVADGWCYLNYKPDKNKNLIDHP